MKYKTFILLTDFGFADSYVGQLKCVISSGIKAKPVFIDLCHNVKQGDIAEAAWHLMVSHKFFPDGAVVIAVVDPGVGSGRKSIVCRAGTNFYLGPDNGIFSWLPLDQCWVLPSYHICSNTFHGRDIFAPEAVKVAENVKYLKGLESCSPDSLARLEKPEARIIIESGRIECSVARIDTFGNVILWLTVEQAESVCPDIIELPDGRRMNLKTVSTYSGTEGLLLLEGSQGFLELVMNGKSCCEKTGLKSGDPVLLMYTGKTSS